MSVILAFLQNSIIAWIVAIVLLIVLIKNAKNNKSAQEAYKIETEKRIQDIRDEDIEKIKNAQLQANYQIQEIRTQCDKAIQQERRLCSEKIKQIEEKIESNKQEIMNRPEKEILADLSISLHSFAKRIERVESRLVPIEQEMEMIVDKVDNIGATVSDAQFHL